MRVRYVDAGRLNGVRASVWDRPSVQLHPFLIQGSSSVCCYST